MGREKIGDAQLAPHKPVTALQEDRHKDYVHCTPPDAPTYREFSVFTAGSIEMGKAVEWQLLMANLLSDLPITVCNPRRPGEWDTTISKEAKNEIMLEQVTWELAAMEKADVICFFFDVDTNSPVTMLELGLWLKSGKVVICCNGGYHRNANIKITCGKYGVPVVETFEELVPKVRQMLEKKGVPMPKET